MLIHPSTLEIVDKFRAAEIHAARSGREVMHALAEVAKDSSADNSKDLSKELEENIDTILEVMPAYAPPLNVMHEVLSETESALRNKSTIDELKTTISIMAETYQTWSREARTRIAQIGAEIIPKDGTVFTFTLSETVLRTLRDAYRQGKQFKVLVTESRPNNDGILTARTLAEEGVQVEVGLDASIGEMVPRADVMIVGAEAILADGSAICKVGTYPSTVIAKSHRIPVYILVDTKKFCTSSLLGLTMWMDPIHREDVIQNHNMRQSNVIGHLFDVTPPEFITAIVTEKGRLNPYAASAIIQKMPVSDKFGSKLVEWKKQKDERGE